MVHAPQVTADLIDKVARAIHAERTPSPFEWLPERCREMYFRMAIKAFEIVRDEIHAPQ